MIERSASFFGPSAGDLQGEIMRIGDRFAVDRGDHVAGLEAGRRAANRLDLGDQRALAPSSRAVGDVLRHRLNLDAEPAARDRAVVLQRLDHALGDVAGDGEADADAAAGRRVDRGVDADDLAVGIEGRAAGIAVVDRRVDLQEVVIGAEPMSRPRAETMPAVTVPPRPNGLPTAITQSPTRGACEAKDTNG